MNSRLHILLQLLSEEQFHTVQELSKQISLSTKTTRNLLKDLDEELRCHGAELVSKYAKGYMLRVTDRSLYEAHTKVDMKQNPIMDTAQSRITALLDHLCSSKQYTKMEDIGDMLYISRQTLSGDIKQVEQVLERHHMNLLRRPNYGICIDGTEWDIRTCICDYAEDRCHAEKERMGRIGSCLAEALKEHSSYMEIRFFRKACVYLSVMMRRAEHGDFLPALNEMDDSEEQIIARRTLQLLEEMHHIRLPGDEITGVCRIIQGKILHQHGTASAQNTVISSQITDLVTEILQAVYDAFKIDLRNDLELIFILCKHLISLKDRVTQNLTPPNPMLQEFKEKYGLAFVMAAHAATVINNAYLIELGEDEIGYLAFGCIGAGAAGNWR